MLLCKASCWCGRKCRGHPARRCAVPSHARTPVPYIGHALATYFTHPGCRAHGRRCLARRVPIPAPLRRPSPGRCPHHRRACRGAKATADMCALAMQSTGQPCCRLTIRMKASCSAKAVVVSGRRRRRGSALASVPKRTSQPWLCLPGARTTAGRAALAGMAATWRRSGTAGETPAAWSRGDFVWELVQARREAASALSSLHGAALDSPTFHLLPISLRLLQPLP